MDRNDLINKTATLAQGNEMQQRIASVLAEHVVQEPTNPTLAEHPFRAAHDVALRKAVKTYLDTLDNVLDSTNPNIVAADAKEYVQTAKWHHAFYTQLRDALARRED